MLPPDRGSRASPIGNRRGVAVAGRLTNAPENQGSIGTCGEGPYDSSGLLSQSSSIAPKRLDPPLRRAELNELIQDNRPLTFPEVIPRRLARDIGVSRGALSSNAFSLYQYRWFLSCMIPLENGFLNIDKTAVRQLPVCMVVLRRLQRSKFLVWRRFSERAPPT